MITAFTYGVTYLRTSQKFCILPCPIDPVVLRQVLPAGRGSRSSSSQPRRPAVWGSLEDRQRFLAARSSPRRRGARWPSIHPESHRKPSGAGHDGPVGAAPGVVVVVDWSLPLEDQSTLETFAQRRAQVAREVKRRLGGSVSDVVLYSGCRVGSVSDLDSRVPLDVVYGSNLQHGLWLARGVCEASGTWRIVLITSSAPSAHLQPNGTPFFSFPTVRATLLATAEEISEFEQADLRRHGGARWLRATRLTTVSSP